MWLLLVGLAVATVRAGGAAEPCAPMIGEIVSVEGSVKLSRAGRLGFERARRGDLLCPGDAVRTGTLSRAAVALANESVLRLDERTELSLRFDQPRERSLLEMVLGAVYLFSHRPRSLEIDTPFVNAGGEGTEFLVRVDADETVIVVYDGRVVARNDRGELGLGSGDVAVATATTPPSPRTIARPRDLVAWAIYYPPVLPALARDEPRALPEGLAAAARAVAEGDYPRALARLDEVPEAARDARWFTYRAGVLLGVGRIEPARAAIARALALDPGAGEALAQRSIIAVARNDVPSALDDTERAVALSPQSGAAWIARSYALQAGLRIEDARDALLRGAEVAPEDALVFARLAEIELSRGDLDRALEAAARAAVLAPDLARTQMVLGFAELVRIDTADARAAFDRAILLDQADPLPHLGRGLAIIRDGDLEAGRRELEIAVGLDPEDAVIRSYLGKAFFEERRDDRAAEQLEIAKRLDPNDPTPWFYDAIRKQLENRPVEALRDLETAIAKNDNRAPYRSSFLLDQDLAVRSVSLARIYDDLGFDQLAVTEASRSLSRDPANWSAHRFLSDAYARLPRHEIARASELLQAQLLQPLNINPVQPSLAFTDLNIVEGIGPAEGAFNEFHPLFERDRVHLTATGVVGDGEGNEDTVGDELVVSALVDRFSLSAGQFHYETDGFRTFDSSEANVYNVFGQWSIAPSINLQSEIRYRSTEEDDLRISVFDPFELVFDQHFFDRRFGRVVDEEIFRLGLRYSPQPYFDVLASTFYIQRDEFFPDTLNFVEDVGYQGEAQVILTSDYGNSVFGFGQYDVDVEDVTSGDRITFNRRQSNGYGYVTTALTDRLDWTVGLSYDDYDERNIGVEGFNPKMGVRARPTNNFEIRAAIFKTIKRALAVEQTLEPVQVAGFTQFFDDVNGSEAWNVGAAIDIEFVHGLRGGFEYRRRDVNEFADFTANFGLILSDDRVEALYRFYIYWPVADRWSLTAELTFDEIERSESELLEFGVPHDVDTLSVPISVSYFNPSGFFATGRMSFYHQEVVQSVGFDFDEGRFLRRSDDDEFWLVDAAVGWRLASRRGLASLEIQNVLDQDFAYQDSNFVASEVRRPPITPGRTVLTRLTFTF